MRIVCIKGNDVLWDQAVEDDEAVSVGMAHPKRNRDTNYCQMRAGQSPII